LTRKTWKIRFYSSDRSWTSNFL